MSEAERTILDLEGALERVEGDRELLVELLEIFFETYENQIEELRAAAQSANAHNLVAVAHSIKGAAGNVGALATSNRARALEAKGREQSFEGVMDIVTQLESEISRLRSYCEEVGLLG